MFSALTAQIIFHNNFLINLTPKFAKFRNENNCKKNPPPIYFRKTNKIVCTITIITLGPKIGKIATYKNL